MSIAVHVKPEQQHIISLAIKAGLLSAPEDAVEIGLETIRQRPQAHPLAASTETNPDQWSRDLHGWIHSHPASSNRPAGTKSLAQLFAESPFKDLNIDFEREQHLGRSIEL